MPEIKPYHTIPFHSATKAINCYKCPDSHFDGVTCTEDSSYIGDAEECPSNSMWCKKTQSKSSAKFDNRK